VEEAAEMWMESNKRLVEADFGIVCGYFSNGDVGE
jgi:hypothetical protein